MTIRGTVILAVVLGLLVGYLVAVPPQPPTAADAGRRLSPPLDDATAAEVVREGALRRFVRRGDTWEPPAAGDLVRTLASLEILDVVDPDPQAPETYGFRADAPRLRVLAGDAELLSIDIGATNPAETGVYVRRRGQRAILLVGALLRWELEKLRRVVPTTPQP